MLSHICIYDMKMKIELKKTGLLLRKKTLMHILAIFPTRASHFLCDGASSNSSLLPFVISIFFAHVITYFFPIVLRGNIACLSYDYEREMCIDSLI